MLKVHGTLSKALKAAVRWRLLPVNPCSDVTPPRPSKANVQALEVRQVKTLLRAAEGTDMYPLWVVLSTTAVRIGEALALRWDDLDLEARTLRVNGTLGQDGVGSPKTAASRRTVRLPKMTVDALQDHHRNGSEFVFSTGKGTSINVCNRIWKPLLVKAGLPADTHIHALRPSAITLHLSKRVAGVPAVGAGDGSWAPVALPRVTARLRLPAWVRLRPRAGREFGRRSGKTSTRVGERRGSCVPLPRPLALQGR